MKKLFSKAKSFLKDNKKLMGISAAVTTMASALAVSASAETATPVSVNDFSGVLDALTAQVNVTTIVAVLGAAVAGSAGLAFMWWGVRKLVRALMSAFKKGKVSL